MSREIGSGDISGPLRWTLYMLREIGSGVYLYRSSRFVSIFLDKENIKIRVQIQRRIRRIQMQLYQPYYAKDLEKNCTLVPRSIQAEEVRSRHRRLAPMKKTPGIAFS
jgi:hypothetical protein